MITLPTEADWLELSLNRSRNETLSEQKSTWNAMAPNFTHKPRRSGYLPQLLELLDLRPDESVLDLRLWRALGRDDSEVSYANGFVILLNYLLQSVGNKRSRYRPPSEQGG